MIVADLSNDWLQRSLDVVMATEQPRLTVIHVPGHHHLHMQAESASIAALIERFARARRSSRGAILGSLPAAHGCREQNWRLAVGGRRSLRS